MAIATSSPTQRPASPTPYSLPLSDPGPYFPGKRGYDFLDEEREREVGVSLWYPAVRPADFDGQFIVDGEPDRSGAPYPLILSSAKVAGIFGPHLTSHGFAMAGIRGIDTWMVWDQNLIDQPLDILFALEQIAAGPLSGLEGLLDADRAGAMGYSFDGYNALALSGARVNPDFLLAQCADPDTVDLTVRAYAYKYQCPLIDSWSAFSAYAGESLTQSEDGLWRAMTNTRLRAVMPMATEGWLLFGAEGLGAVEIPVLMITSTRDTYYQEHLEIYEYLGADEKALITFVDQNHMMIYNAEMVDRMQHFAAAFFGLHLQGRTDYAGYLSSESIAGYGDLRWGLGD